MSNPIKRALHVSMFAALLSVFIVAPAQATPIVVANVSLSAGLFHYDYSITFDSNDDEIFLLDVVALIGDASLTNTTAPSGYVTTYDSGLGLISFLPSPGNTFPTFPSSSTSILSTITLSGFALDSIYGPGLTSFQAYAVTGGLYTGTTTGPVGAAAVPEPASCVLLATGLGAFARRAWRKRKADRGLSE